MPLDDAIGVGAFLGGVLVLPRCSADGLAVVVEDNGPGIPPEVASQIFEPFFTTKEVGKGSGLGLSVCQGLVSAAGGSLHLDPAAVGARFVIWLPAATVEDGVNEAPALGVRSVPSHERRPRQR